MTSTARRSEWPRRVWRHLPTKAALAVAQYLLPALERQPIHSAPEPQQYDWVREIVNRAGRLVDEIRADAREPRGAAWHDDVEKLEAAAATCGRKTFDRFALECAADALCSAVAYFTKSPFTRARVAWASSPADWAACAVHMAMRALHDDEVPIRGCIERVMTDEAEAEPEDEDSPPSEQ